MSLINDALKKAQRVRYEEPEEIAQPGASAKNPRIAKRGRAQSANTTILLGSGALVLVVLSVVATVYLVNRAPETAGKPAMAGVAAADAKSTVVAPTVDAPKLEMPSVAPQANSATTTASVDPVASPRQTAAAGAPADPVPVPVIGKQALPAPIVITTPGPPAAPTPAKPDEGTLLFVESIKVAGVRSSGNESRVLMNERVYRVNDIVERNLGLKLVAVAPGILTFSDSAGATYVKNF